MNNLCVNKWDLDPIIMQQFLALAPKRSDFLTTTTTTTTTTRKQYIMQIHSALNKT